MPKIVTDATAPVEAQNLPEQVLRRSFDRQPVAGSVALRLVRRAGRSETVVPLLIYRTCVIWIFIHSISCNTASAKTKKEKMPVDMYLYLPLDGSAGENMTIVDHANEIAAIFAKPVEKKVRVAWLLQFFFSCDLFSFGASLSLVLRKSNVLTFSFRKRKRRMITTITGVAIAVAVVETCPRIWPSSTRLRASAPSSPGATAVPLLHLSFRLVVAICKISCVCLRPVFGASLSRCLTLF